MVLFYQKNRVDQNASHRIYQMSDRAERISINGWDPQKGHRSLIEAFRLLVDAYQAIYQSILQRDSVG